MADIECRPAESGLVYDCTIKLTEASTGTRVSGAIFTVGADMPSMPMVHNIRPVRAVPAAGPGLYQARLELEMYGTWMVKLQVSIPAQDQIVQKIDFAEPH